MFHTSAPQKAGLPREVAKWLQSLELSLCSGNVRRDFSNGYLMAEIFSHYYPKAFAMHSYDKGASLSAKQRNWSLIQKSLQKQNLHLKKDAVDGTIHCTPGVAELLVQEVFTMLTNRSIRCIQGPKSNITDQNNQEPLPTLTSSSMADNVQRTEVQEHKAAARDIHPGDSPKERLKAKPNLGQLAAKNVAPSSGGEECAGSPSSAHTASNLCSSSTWSGKAVSYKEIKVRQPVKHSWIDD
ncbi:uncharacterized protein V6R79_017889 [Siganus canaliculatus]